jgi:hypothetical protein
LFKSWPEASGMASAPGHRPLDKVTAFHNELQAFEERLQALSVDFSRFVQRARRELHVAENHGANTAALPSQPEDGAAALHISPKIHPGEGQSSQGQEHTHIARAAVPGAARLEQQDAETSGASGHGVATEAAAMEMSDEGVADEVDGAEARAMLPPSTQQHLGQLEVSSFSHFFKLHGKDNIVSVNGA